MVILGLQPHLNHTLISPKKLTEYQYINIKKVRLKLKIIFIL